MKIYYNFNVSSQALLKKCFAAQNSMIKSHEQILKVIASALGELYPWQAHLVVGKAIVWCRKKLQGIKLKVCCIVKSLSQIGNLGTGPRSGATRRTCREEDWGEYVLPNYFQGHVSQLAQIH